MATPYDGKVLLVNHRGRTTPGATVAALAKLIHTKMPNVAGVMLKTSDGVSWQGHLVNDNDPKAITGVTRIQEWVAAFDARALEVHVWGVPRAKRLEGANLSADIGKEAEKFSSAASVPGVKSLLLDVEHGPYYWLGTPNEARDLMRQIREGVPAGTHIGLILDGRRNRPFEFWVDPWIPFVDSLHPMVYPILFDGGRTIEQHLDEAFQNLAVYHKPIVPMLQAFGDAGGRPTPQEVTRQGNAAFSRGAAGISYFRLSSDAWADGRPHMGEPEYAAIAAVTRPGLIAAPAYTWQMVINAVSIVALRANADYDEWLGAIGFWHVFSNALRPKPYSGPPIADWPMPADRIAQIQELLQHSAAEIYQLLIQTRNEKALAEKKTGLYGSNVGVHGAPGVAAPPAHMWNKWIDYLKEMGIKWYKQCDNGDPNDTGPQSIYAWAIRLKQEGITPIVRYLVPEQFPNPLPAVYFDKMRLYAQAGIVWAEIGNEPNLKIEWQEAWQNRVGYSDDETIRRIAETWVTDARHALDAGVKPAFYAFAPTDWHGQSNSPYSSVFFTRYVVAYLAQHCRAETIDIFQRGGWIAAHAATYEQPCNFDPFGQPGGVVWDMTLRSYEVVLRAFRDSFGNALNVDNLVVMSTEGGVFTPSSTSMSGHVRLTTGEEHAQRTVEMFRWLEHNAPLQAMCPWCLSVGDLIGHFDSNFRFDGWIEDINGQLCPRPVYDAMRQLRFDHEREAKEAGAIKLAVPYLSQFDETAATHGADCGPACLAMILNAQPSARQVTVDEFYQLYLPNIAYGTFTTITQMVTAGTRADLAPRRVEHPGGAQQALDDLHALVQQNTPFVVLVNYAKWDDVARNNFKGGHFVLVTGCDDEYVYVHDPLFRGSAREQGQYFVWSNERFLSGWGSCHENVYDGISNPDFVAIVPNKQVARLT